MRRPFRFAGILLVTGATIPAAVLTAQSTTGAPAQADTPSAPYGGPHRGGPEHRVEMLQRELNLTPDQVAQVKTVLGTERTKMEALHSNTALSGADRHSQMTAIHADTNTQVRALLTTDQATKYDAMEARMREHREQGSNPPPPPPPAGPGL